MKISKIIRGWGEKNKKQQMDTRDKDKPLVGEG